VLGVVQAEQHPPVGEVGGQRARRPTHHRYAHRAGDRLGDGRTGTEDGQVHPPDAVRVPVVLTAGHPRCQAGLAGAAGPGHGHQPVARQHRAGRLELGAAADE
jgi:hypothetical protein